VNTLKRLEDGRLLGDNTDGAGLVRDLVVNAGIALQGRRILLLGAGGAVRGVLEPLLAEQPAALVIANRTVEKAEQLAHEFADLGPVVASAYDWLDESVDLIINGTSASLAGELPPLAESLVQPGHTCCYDMMYGAEPTPFNRWATRLGAQPALDGLGMLVEQAAEAFYLWRGVRPQTAPVREHLRQLLQASG
jgi:shikimate dehydrogenase